MKKVIKNPIFTFILGALIFGSGVLAANTLMARDIKYTPKDTNWAVDNVEAAINSLQLSKTESNYSTDEQVVGTWIDGKPLYQKTYEVTAPSSSAVQTTVATYPTTFNIKKLDGSLNGMPINIFSGSNYYVDSFAAAGNIYIEQKNMAPGVSGTITIQYTKTTDTATN